MEALVLSVMTVASIRLAAGADNGVWRGDDDRHYPHYHDGDDFYDPYYHAADRSYYDHYHERAPEPIGLVFPQPDTSSPTTGMDISRPINVFDSGTPQSQGFGLEQSHNIGHIPQVGDTATIIVHGDEHDPHYDAIEYETYSGPYHAHDHEHYRGHYHDEDPHYYDEQPYNHDDDYHDDYEYHDHHMPDDYHEPRYHHRDQFDDDNDDENDDEKLAERARESFSDEIEQEMQHGNHGPYIHDVEPAIIVDHDLKPMTASNMVVDNPENTFNDHDHLVDDHGHAVVDHGHGVHNRGDVIDDAEMIDSDEFGDNHDVIELPSFTTPAAHSGKNNKAVVMIGDVAPSSD